MTKRKDLPQVKMKWLIILSCFIYLILASGRALTNLPAGDEGLMAEPAVNLARNGSLGQTIGMFGVIPEEDLAEYTYWHPPLSFLLGALVFKLFGVGLFQARFISVIWGLIGLIAIYYIAKTLFKDNKKAILFSIALVAVDYSYISSSSIGRMDLMAASLSLTGFAIYFVWREKNFNLAVLLANLFICLSGLTHPCGFLGLLILIFLIFHKDRKRFKIKIFLLSLSPYILGAVAWGTYILRDIDAFRMQFFGGQIFFLRAETWASGLNWVSIHHEIVYRYFYSYGISPLNSSVLEAFKSLILFFFMFNLVIAPFVLKRKIRIIWYMLIICFLGMMFLISNKAGSYLCWITPLLILNSVAVWQEIGKSKILYRSFLSFFMVIMLLSVAGSGYVIQKNPYKKLHFADLKLFNETYYKGGKIYGLSSLAFFYDFDPDILQDDLTMGFFSGIKSRYFVMEEGYQYEFRKIQNAQSIENFFIEGAQPMFGNKHKNLVDQFKKRGGIKALWEHISKTLEEEYILVFKGKHYTFYERKEHSQKNYPFPEAFPFP